MPRKVDEFVPYRLLVYLVGRLGAISEATGYNCTPFVTTDLHEFENSTAQHTLFIESSKVDPEAQGVGGDGPLVQTSAGFTVVGVSKYTTEHARRIAMALEQDARTAIHSGVSEIRSAVGRGCSLRFGGCQHDGGFLAPDKEAGFRLEVSFTWSQGSDW